MKKYFLFLLMAISATLVMAQSKHLLRLNLPVGKVRNYSLKATVCISSSDVKEVRMETDMGLDNRCVAKENGIYRLEQKITSLSATVSTGEEKIPLPEVKQMEDAVIKMNVDELGKMTQPLEVAGQGKLSLSTLDPKSLMSSITAFPEQAVGVGDTWTAEEMLNGVKAVFTSKVVEAVEGGFRLEVVATIPKLPLQTGGQAVTAWGSFKHDFIIDFSTGMVRQGTFVGNSEFYIQPSAENAPLKIVTQIKM